MKQVKFFLVALMAVVMGMSVTSCMNGDDNHNVTMTVPVKYNYSSFLMGDGTTKLVPTTELGLLDGIMYIISCQYDQSQVSANSNSIPVAVIYSLCIDPKGDESLSTTKTKPTNPLYTLDKQQSSLVYYDKNTIVLTMPYWVKVTNSSVEESELKKHSFCLSYNPDEIESNATKLNLYISHRVEDGEESVTRSNFTYAYRAYLISSALYQFKEKWEEISMEEDRRKVYIAFVYPMIGLCGLSVFIGSLLTNGWGGPQSFQIAMTNCCAVAVALFGGYFLAAYAINEMGTRMFGMHSNMPLTQQFAGYALVVPFLLQIVTGLLPDFRIIAWLLQFYIVYVVWEGVPVLMGVEEKQRLKYTLLSSVLLILCPAVIQIVFNRLTAILN